MDKFDQFLRFSKLRVARVLHTYIYRSTTISQSSLVPSSIVLWFEESSQSWVNSHWGPWSLFNQCRKKLGKLHLNAPQQLKEWRLPTPDVRDSGFDSSQIIFFVSVGVIFRFLCQDWSLLDTKVLELDLHVKAMSKKTPPAGCRSPHTRAGGLNSEASHEQIKQTAASKNEA